MVALETVLTDSQWAKIAHLFDARRKRKHQLRKVLDAIFYILRIGGQWRNLPSEHGDWRAIYYYFYKFTKDGTFIRMTHHLNLLDRERCGAPTELHGVVVDSQSVKLAPMVFEDRGVDGNKKVNGRKRHYLTDTAGRLYLALVTAANIHDSVGGTPLVSKSVGLSSTNLVYYIDHGYLGNFSKELEKHGIQYEVAARPEGSKGFVPLKKRWVVERTIAWTNFYRRLCKDHEHTTASSESWLYLTNSKIMLQRLK